MIPVLPLLTLALTNAFIYSSYPTSGIYGDNANVYLVDIPRSVVNFIPRPTFDTLFDPYTLENISGQLVSTSISESTLLKAIAISQKPELAKELVNV